jgi:predicted DsbA family dithiol-disulfide isomerase
MPLRIVHVTAPGCSWSWGYEPVFQRIRAVYGDQVPIDLVIDCPYHDIDQWMKDYEMASWDEAMAFFREGVEKMGLPMVDWTPETIPRDVLPASLAAIAAGRQGPPGSGRFLRILTRRINVEGQDPGKPEVLRAAAKEAGLDLARFEKDLADDEGITSEYGDQGVSVPRMPMGFYNLVITDDETKSLVLDHAFDPAVVESAIDWMSGGALKKRQPTDVVGYAVEEGPVSQVEVQRVFALSPRDALAKLEAGEKAGRLGRVTLAGAPHWRKAA